MRWSRSPTRTRPPSRPEPPAASSSNSRLGEEGGGWPGTFEDAAAAIDAVAELDSTLDTSRVVVVGHSAGGHLAAWSAHRAALPAGAPGSEPKVRLAGAVSLAGVLDLVAADQARLGTVLADPNAEPPAGAPEPSWPEVWPEVAAGVHDDVVNLLLGGHADAVPDRIDPRQPSWANVRQWIADQVGRQERGEPR